MSDRTKNKMVTLVFVAFFAIASLLLIFHKPNDLSKNERRKLAKYPVISWDRIVSSKYMEEFDKYSLDQFPYRDSLRKLKGVTQLSLFHQKDNNGIFIVGNTVSKIEYPLNETSILNAADKFNYLYDTYFKDKDMLVYYSIIPDKNHFIAKANGYPSIDEEKLVTMMQEHIDHMKYINIFDCLTIEDYYTTDTHWRQEKLGKVLERIATDMGFMEGLTKEYKIKKYSPFYGVYYGQAALPMAADSISYMVNEITESSTAYNYETQERISIYDMKKRDSNDPYELFLSGAVSFMTIENPQAKTDQELVIFRDSFGSSIAPLFIEAYKKITLIDIRYITSDLIKDFIVFENQDILFLYSTGIINNSSMLK